MKAYIIQIVGAALLSVFADMLSPAGWKKYMGIITGIILLTVIITPVARLGGADLLSVTETSEEISVSGEELYSDMLKKEFSKSVALDVKERMRREFSAEVSVEAEVEVNEKGNIDRISKIIVTGKDLNEEMSERISYIYDVGEVVLNAVG